MKRKLLLILFGASCAGAFYLLEQTLPIGAGAALASGGSVGSLGVIQASNGSGGFQQATSGAGNPCSVDPGGQNLNCYTFTIANRQYTGSASTTTSTPIGPCTGSPPQCTWQLFPDQSYYNTPVNTYPPDPNALLYANATTYLADGLIPISNATWAGGTATITVPSNTIIVSGQYYNITGVLSSNCSGGGDCGFNDNANSVLYGSPTNSSTYPLTGSGTTYTYPLPNNPGSYTGSGFIHYNATTTTGAFLQTRATYQLRGLLHHVPNMPYNQVNNTSPTTSSANTVWGGNQGFVVTGATNTTPIVITATGTQPNNGYYIQILMVGGNTAANGFYYAKTLTATTFSLYYDSGLSLPVAGNGAYTSGGGGTAPTNTQPAEVPNITDGGPYPISATSLMEGQNDTLASGYQAVTVANSLAQAGDNHIFSLNFDLGKFFETYSSFANQAPFLLGNGVVWDLSTCDNKTNQRWLWYGNDSTGVTSSDVAGIPTQPLVLTYAELFGGSPIHHVIRIGIPCQTNGYYNGITWPAGHGSNSSSLTGAPPVGTRLILNSSFDTTTCHFGPCAGIAYPSWMAPFFTAAKNYGIIVADCGGGFISIISDYDSRWGAVDDFGNISGTTTTCGGASQQWGSCTTQFNAFISSIHWSDFTAIEPSAHIININSHAVK